MRGLTVSTPPGSLASLVERGLEAAGVIALGTAGAFDQVALRLSLLLAAGAGARAIVAGPAGASLDQHRQLRWGARRVQSRTANAAAIQTLFRRGLRAARALRAGCRCASAAVALVVVRAGSRRTQALLAYR